jgi:hypothetical protein
MSAAASLDGIRVGERVTAKCVREPLSGRILALELVAARPRPARTPAEDEATSARVWSLLVDLLAELSVETRVLDCKLHLEIDRYAIRLEMPGTPDRAVLMPQGVLKRALRDPGSRRAVSNALRSAVTLLRSQRALDGVRRGLLQRDDLRAHRLGPRCIRCEGPLSLDDPIVEEAGSHGHLACPPTR